MLGNQLPILDAGNIFLSVSADFVGEPFCRSPWDRLFTGGVHVGQHQDIGVIECGDKVIEQLMGAGIAVRLECGHNPAFRPSLAGGGQRRFDFGRVMAVVVNHHNPLGLPLHGKAPSDAAERGKPLLNGGKRHIQFQCHGDAGHGVQHIMRSRHREGNLPQPVPFEVGDK